MTNDRSNRWSGIVLVAVSAVILSSKVLAGEVGAISPRHTVNRESYFPQVSPADGDGIAEIAMTVGMIDERHRAVCIAPGASASATLGSFASGDVLMLRFVIPDDIEGHRYDFEATLDGATIQKRSGETRGFGRRTVFIPLSGLPATTASEPGAQPGQSHTIVVTNRGGEPLYIADLSLLPKFESRYETPFPENDFTLGLLVGESNDPGLLERVAKLIDAPTVRKAIASEIYYATRTEGQLEEIARASREVCEKLGVDFLAATCSWWAGTPPVVRERIEFQQICWSESDTHDDGEGLKKLMGDKWDIRYGLSIPNMWSSTPWQTMNNAELNTMRRGKMRRAVEIFEKELPGRMAGYVSENEPAYWAFKDADAKYPVVRKNLWADFNPSTVADAKRDGVELDPSDGLDIIERIWLHYNVARYNEGNIAAMQEAKPSGTVYSHALLDYNHFPLHGTGHARPYAEAARVTNAHLGVEMLWTTDMDALWRIREWGPWGCVNREECDGMDIRYHLATMRAAYMIGADLFNSYNWGGMGREGDPVEYFNTVLKEIGDAKPIVLAERTGGSDWKPLKEWSGALEKNAGTPWATGIALGLKAGKDAGTLAVWLTKSMDGDVVAYRRIAPAMLSSDGDTVVDFGDLTQLRQDNYVAVHLQAEGDWSIRAGEAGPDYRLLCDMKRERIRSKAVIGPAAGTDSVTLTLKRVKADR